jgi:hypothetical protein
MSSDAGFQSGFDPETLRFQRIFTHSPSMITSLSQSTLNILLNENHIDKLLEGEQFKIRNNSKVNTRNDKKTGMLRSVQECTHSRSLVLYIMNVPSYE